MNDTKINLTILVPGATMLSEQECSKQLKKPIINTKGKYAGKQARDKAGKPLWYYTTIMDSTKCTQHTIKVNSSEKKGEKELITFYTRKTRKAKQTLNISREAYEYFISKEAPFGYRAPKDFKPYGPRRSRMDRKTKEWVEGTPIDVQSWRSLSEKEKLDWHMNAIAASMNGVVDSYVVFDD